MNAGPSNSNHAADHLGCPRLGRSLLCYYYYYRIGLRASSTFLLTMPSEIKDCDNENDSTNDIRGCGFWKPLYVLHIPFLLHRTSHPRLLSAEYECNQKSWEFYILPMQKASWNRILQMVLHNFDSISKPSSVFCRPLVDVVRFAWRSVGFG